MRLCNWSNETPATPLLAGRSNFLAFGSDSDAWKNQDMRRRIVCWRTSVPVPTFASHRGTRLSKCRNQVEHEQAYDSSVALASDVWLTDQPRVGTKRQMRYTSIGAPALRFTRRIVAIFSDIPGRSIKVRKLDNVCASARCRGIRSPVQYDGRTGRAGQHALATAQQASVGLSHGPSPAPISPETSQSC